MAETEISVLSSNTISELGKKQNKEKRLFFFEWFGENYNHFFILPGLGDKYAPTIACIFHFLVNKRISCKFKFLFFHNNIIVRKYKYL